MLQVSSLYTITCTIYCTIYCTIHIGHSSGYLALHLRCALPGQPEEDTIRQGTDRFTPRSEEGLLDTGHLRRMLYAPESVARTLWARSVAQHSLTVARCRSREEEDCSWRGREVGSV